MKAVIALGSNLGNPNENLDLAIALLREASNVEKESSYYITKPVGYEDQPDFVNAVCIIETELPAMELLNMLHGIEKAMGRERTIKWGPRTIDLDIIQYGTLLSKAEELTLPHPRAHERKFVLEPWAEIEPDAILLTHGKISELISKLQLVSTRYPSWTGVLNERKGIRPDNGRVACWACSVDKCCTQTQQSCCCKCLY